MAIEHRRSPRIMFSIPVTVRGVTEEGKLFEVTGRTVTLNRHGARVQITGSLKPGALVRVGNQVSGEDAEFRVVGPVAPPLDRVSQWGIECVHVDKNIWGIQFPAMDEHSDAQILLACRTCRSMSLHSLSLVEVEVLETAGLLTKPCMHCGQSTSWGYPQRAFDLETMTYQAAVNEATAGMQVERRISQRKAAKLPVRVRDYYGEIEVARTENVSQEGFCFSSPRNYLVGQGIVVICPFDEANEKPEVRARIVRVQAGSSSDQFVYGVRYDLGRH